MSNNFPSQFIKPMEPVPYPQPIEDCTYLYQVKWDGVRVLAWVEHGQVLLLNKNMRDRTKQFIELRALPEMITAQTALFDGEVVVLKDGKPNFAAVIKRDHCSNDKTIQHLVNSTPIDYMVFDLLHINGKDLLNCPLSTRKSELESMVEPGDWLHIVEDFSDGKSLFAGVEALGMEGIVAKKKDSRYLQGKKHKEWLKIKCRRSQYCVVGGFTLRAGIVNSLLLGVFNAGELFFVGKAASGLTYNQQQILSQQLPLLEKENSPFYNLSDKNKSYHYVEPQLVVKIEFMEWTDNLILRSPVIKDFVRVNPRECKMQ